MDKTIGYCSKTIGCTLKSGFLFAGIRCSRNEFPRQRDFSGSSSANFYGHKPGKHGKPGKLREFEKLSKSQGKLREI